MSEKRGSEQFCQKRKCAMCEYTIELSAATRGGGGLSLFIKVKLLFCFQEIIRYTVLQCDRFDWFLCISLNSRRFYFKKQYIVV